MTKIYLKDKNARLNVRIPSDLLSSLVSFSVKSGVPVSDLVRAILAKWVMQNENKAANQHNQLQS